MKLFNSVALLRIEKLTATGLKIRAFRLQQKTLNNFNRKKSKKQTLLHRFEMILLIALLRYWRGVFLLVLFHLYFTLTGIQILNTTTMPTKRYRVYVIELSKRVFTESVKFRTANPQYNGILECLYVGMTSSTPQRRLDQHLRGLRSKKGHKLSSSLVQKYGLYLRPSLYSHLALMTRQEALKTEEELAIELRRQRYAVWFG